MTGYDLTCGQMAHFLMQYLDRELDQNVRAAFEHHLSLCPDCVCYVASYKRTVELGKRAFADEGAPPPADVPKGLIQAILKATTRKG